MSLPVPQPDATGFAESNAVFALTFYTKLAKTAGNVAFSPLGLEGALVRTWAGARGETAAQMKQVLGVKGTAEQAISAMAMLTPTFGGGRDGALVKVLNRLFISKDYAIDPTFLALGGETLAVDADFRNHPEDSRLAINMWVSTETENRITDLVPPGAVDRKTRLVLANAIYFKGRWAQPFPKNATAHVPFFVSPSSPKPVPTMRITENVGYASVDGVKLVELPYLGGALGLLVVLPDWLDGLAAVEARLSRSTLAHWGLEPHAPPRAGRPAFVRDQPVQVGCRRAAS